MADPIIALRDILQTNWSKPPEPSIEDIADLDKGDAKRVRMLDNDVIRIFETAHNEAQPELLYDYVNEHVNITIDIRTVDSRDRLSELRNEVRRIVHGFRKGDGTNFDRAIFKTRTDLSDRSKKLFRYTLQYEIVTFSLLANAEEPVVNPSSGEVSGGNTYQTYDGDLTTLAQMTPSDSVFIVGNGSNWAAESGATARTSLGLGSMATQNSDAISITGGSISGVSGLVSSITAGTGITGSATDGAVTLNVGALTVSELAANSLQLSSESFADNDTSLMTSAAIQDKILSYGYTTEVGDITAVTAGTGMTGGGSSGAVTLTLDLKDEDNMASNSATHAASQQSIKAYVDSEVAALIDNAPGALDTLNELAAAINDDAGFTGTITTALGNRVRADASQSFSSSEQLQARTNIGLNAASVPTAGTGIGISGSEISVDVSDFMSNGVNNYLLTATGADTFQGESTLTYDGSVLKIDNGGDEVITIGGGGSGYQSIELGGDTGAYIDLKSPNSDDFDIRIITTGNGGEIVTASPLTFKTSNNNDDITFTPHGTGKIKFGSGSDYFELPTARGSTNQILKSNGSGEISWAADDNDNHTYAISSATVTGGANLVLTAGGSGSGTDTVKLLGGTNTTISQSSDEITVVSNDTTYSTSVVDSSDDALIRLTAGGSGSGNDDIKLVAGANVTLTPDTGTSPPQITITASTQGDITGITAGTGLSGGGSNGDVTLNVDVSEFSAVTPASGDSFLTLDSDGSTEQRTTVDALATLLAGTNISASSGVLSSTDTNTFRTVTAGGETLGASETLAFTAGSNVTITESNGAVTIASTDTNTNTQLSQEQVEDFVGGMLDGTETFISVSYDDTDGNIDFVVPVLDEDNMASNSATNLVTQQSIKAYVDSKTASIVDSAPAALDTLNELAAALNDDASFSTTTATSLGNRLRIDDNQSLSGTQQAQGLTNLGFTATLAEINILDDGLSASDIPSLATSKITSGTFADARIAQSNVTQHLAVGSGGGIGLSGKTFTLDLDGMTDIGAALVDADLLIVDDGAGGTNRKATMSRLKTYMQNGLTFTTNTNTNQLTTFTLTADSGSNQTIEHGNTLDIAGSSPIVTSVGGTDTVTVSLDDPANLSELTESTDATDDKILLWDESASSWKYMTIDNLQDSIDTASGGGAVSAVANGANNRIVTFSSADALNGEANLVFDGTSFGIGESSPLFPLHLKYTDNRTDPEGSGSSSGAGAVGVNAQGGGLFIENLSTTDGSWAGVTFRTDTADARIAYQSVGSSLTNEGQMSFFLDTNDSPNQLTLEEVFRLRGGASGGNQTFNSAYVNGRLGVGTASPGKTLHVSDGSTSGITGGTNAALLITDDANPRIYFEDVGEGSGDRVMDIMYDSESLSFNSLNDAASAYDTQNIMVINRDGNVGIGVSDPDKTLEVDSGSTNLDGIKITGSGVNTSFTIDNTGTNGGKYRMSVTSGSHGDGTNKLLFQDNNTARMTIDGSGKVGIGTTSPSTELDVNGTITATAMTMGNLKLRSTNEFETDSGSIHMQYDTGNDVEVGSTGTNADLVVVGRVGISPTTRLSTPDTTLHIEDDSTGLKTLLLLENTGSAGNSGTLAGLEIRNSAGTDSSTHIEQDAFGGTRFYTGQGSKNLFMTVAADGQTTTIPGSIAGTATNATLAATVTVSNSTANTNFPVVFHDESNALLDDTGALRYNPSTGTLLVPNLSVAGTTTQVNTVTMEAQNAIVFEGATADAHETTLTITDPTADRTITLPNNTGTVALTIDNVAGLNAVDDRDLAPEDLSYANDFNVFFTSKEGLEDGSTIGGNYMDAIVLNTWSDASGHDANVLAFDKSTKAIYHYQADQAATNWGTASQLAYLDSTMTGNAAFTGTLTVGVDDTGHDVKFFGATSGAYMLYDQSADQLIVHGPNDALLMLNDGNDSGSHMSVAGGRAMVGYSGNNLFLGASSGKGVAFGVNNGTFGSGEVARFDTSGKFGIGTTSPATKLHIERSESDSENLMLRLRDSTVNTVGDRIGIEGYWNTVPAGDIEFELTNTSSGAAAIVFSPHSGSSTKNEAMRIASDGNVGIGTTSPAGNLHISSGTSGDATVIIEADTDNNAEGDTPKLWFKADGGINEGAIILNDNELDIISNVASSGGIRFLTGTTSNTGATSPLTNATERMKITSAGRVGIGTTSPSAPLHVYRDAGNYFLAGTDSNSGADAHAGFGSFVQNKNMNLPFWNLEVNHTTSLSSRQNEVFRLHSNEGHANSKLVRMTVGNTRASPTTEAFAIDYAGKVGIGTTTPTVNLHVADATDPKIRVQDTTDNYAATLAGYSGGAYLALGDMDITNTESSWMLLGAFNSINNLNTRTRDFHLYGTNTTTGFYFDESAGKFGIGTTSPQAPLHVVGNVMIASTDSDNTVKDSRILGRTYTNNDYNLIYGYADSNTNRLYLGGGTGTGEPATDIRFFTAALNADTDASGTEAMRILSNGYVGIGTTSATFPLDVNGWIATASGIVHTGDTNNTIQFDTDIQKFNTAGTTRMMIAADGKVAIGSTSATATLDVTIVGSNTTTSGIAFGDASKGYLAAGSSFVSFATNDGTTRIAIDNGGSNVGNVGIGTTTPTHKLEVNGSFAATTKSFDIEHPTKEGKRLHHGSLEGPEHGVYVRGRLEGDVIELPDYWLGLVDADTITVQLTPNNGFQQIYVDHIEGNKVYVGTQTDSPIDCFYFIQAERVDVEKMVVEY